MIVSVLPASQSLDAGSSIGADAGGAASGPFDQLLSLLSGNPPASTRHTMGPAGRLDALLTTLGQLDKQTLDAGLLAALSTEVDALKAEIAAMADQTEHQVNGDELTPVDGDQLFEIPPDAAVTIAAKVLMTVPPTEPGDVPPLLSDNGADARPAADGAGEPEALWGQPTPEPLPSFEGADVDITANDDAADATAVPERDSSLTPTPGPGTGGAQTPLLQPASPRELIDLPRNEAERLSELSRRPDPTPAVVPAPADGTNSSQGATIAPTSLDTAMATNLESGPRPVATPTGSQVSEAATQAVQQPTVEANEDPIADVTGPSRVAGDVETDADPVLPRVQDRRPEPTRATGEGASAPTPETPNADTTNNTRAPEGPAMATVSSPGTTSGEPGAGGANASTTNAPAAPIGVAVPSGTIETRAPSQSSEATMRPLALSVTTVEQLQDMQRGADARRRIVVRLDPPELGSITLDLTALGDDVRLVARAESPEAVRALLRQQADVQQALAAHGMSLLDFDVHDGAAENRQRTSSDRDQGGAPRGDGSEAAALDESITLTNDQEELFL